MRSPAGGADDGVVAALLGLLVATGRTERFLAGEATQPGPRPAPEGEDEQADPVAPAAEDVVLALVGLQAVCRQVQALRHLLPPSVEGVASTLLREPAVSPRGLLR